MTAPKIVLEPDAINVNFATPAAESKVWRPPNHKLVRYPPRSAPSVLPAASAVQAKTGPAPPNCALAAHAVMKIAGQMRIPQTSTAAQASPVAGQIGGAPGWTATAKVQPRFAIT